MSRTSGIDFKFTAPYDIRQMIDHLSTSNVSLISQDSIWYLVDYDDAFDWQRAPASELTTVINLLSALQRGSALAGLIVTLDSSGVGGDIIFTKDRLQLLFTATVNRRTIAQSSFTDLGWYLARLIPILEPLGLSELSAHDYP